jgi:hypothetical protein
MTPERAALLEAVPGWEWEVDREAAWRGQLRALAAFIAAHGHIPALKHPSGLGEWVGKQRQAKKAMDEGRSGHGLHKMTRERARLLEALPGWAWDACTARLSSAARA